MTHKPSKDIFQSYGKNSKLYSAGLKIIKNVSRFKKISPYR